MGTQYIVEIGKFKGYCKTVVKDGKILYSNCQTFSEYDDQHPFQNLELLTESEYFAKLEKFESDKALEKMEKVNCEYCNRACIPPANLPNWCNGLCYDKWEYIQTLSTDEEYQTWRATYYAK